MTAGLTIYNFDELTVSADTQRSNTADAIARSQGIGLLAHWLTAKREQHHPGELIHCLPGWEPVPLPITLLYAYGHQSRRTHALLEFLRSQVPVQWCTPKATV